MSKTFEVGFHRLGEGLAALDIIDEAGHYFAKTRVFQTVAEILEALRRGHLDANQMLR